MKDVRYSIAEADLSQAGPAIVAVWIRNFVGYDAQGALAKLRLGYVNNPAGLGSVLLVHADGQPELQGTLGVHPRTFHLGSRTRRAAGLADFAVNEEHRSLGPAMMLLRGAERAGASQFDLIYGIPNARAAPVFAAAGFKRVGSMRRYALLLTSRERLAKRVPDALALCLAPVVDRILDLLDWTRNLRAAGALHCRAEDWSSKAFDEIWQRKSSALLLSERSGRMLQWRFAAPGRREWRVCLAQDDEGTDRGYIIWRGNAGAVEIGDFFADEPSKWTTPLMLGFSRHVKRLGYRSISVQFYGDERVSDGLRKAGMVLRTEQRSVFLTAARGAKRTRPRPRT